MRELFTDYSSTDSDDMDTVTSDNVSRVDFNDLGTDTSTNQQRAMYAMLKSIYENSGWYLSSVFRVHHIYI